MATSKMNENDSDSHCIRGLEPFQDDYTNEHFQSKKKLHHSTIKIEQTRQALLGIKDPERFRELVAPQSEIALRRAQELAAQDQKEIYPFRPNPAANSVGAKQLQNDHIPIQNMSTTSSADMTRLRGLMDSIYGGSPNTASFMADSAGASVVSDADVSSTGSNCSSSSSESNNSSQSLFADESIRKLQERSMRRLMGIYQNNSGEGVAGDKETNALFKFARRDSLLGIRNNNSRDSNSTPSTNKVCAVPNEPILSRQEQLLEMLHRQQLQERLQHQQAAEEATPSLEKQLIEMLHRRQQLEEHFQQQQQVSHREIPLHLQKELLEMIHRRNLMQDNGQQQQQQASAMKTAPSLQERLIDMIQHQQQMQGHEQHQQASSTLSAMMQSMGSDNGSINNANSLIEEYLIQQQQHHQEHQNKMKLALMAMNASRFPIRRDTLSHVHMAWWKVKNIWNPNSRP